MNKFKVASSLCLILVIYFTACKKDPKIETYQPTPYTLDLPKFFSQYEPIDQNPLTKEGVELGRRLFYDPILSEDGTQSCASCHNQKFAFTDNGLAKSVGIKGFSGSRNSMPLFNLSWHNKGFFWDGRSQTLREQVLIPIEDPIEMASTVEGALARINAIGTYNSLFYKAYGKKQATEVELAKALEQFLLTIVSSNSKYDRYRRNEATLTQQELEGGQFIQAENNPAAMQRGADCFHCHGTSGELFTNHDFFNNGMDAQHTDLGYFNFTGLESDKGKFKTPSLRNLGFTAPYMHDGRFNTLEEVLDHYGDHVKFNSPNIDPNIPHSRLLGQIQFTRAEKDMMIAFLNTLNDSTMVNNPAFSNPFIP